MYLKVTQNTVGHFNLINASDETFEFSMALFNEDGIVEKDGVKAKLKFSGDFDTQYEFETPDEDIDYIFELCYEYSKKVFSPSIDYEAQCLLFAELYVQHYDEINQHRQDTLVTDAQKQIKQLQSIVDDPPELTLLERAVDYTIDKQIEKTERYIAKYLQLDLEQLKEDSEKYQKTSEQIEKKQQYIERLKEAKRTILNE